MSAARNIVGALACVSVVGACLLSLAGCSLPPEVQAQQERIRAEPLGDYWVGRRFHLKGSRVWGYLRRPRELWGKSQLVIMDERRVRQPDRLPEDNYEGLSHGYDHNFEYHLLGHLSGQRIYDPNSNLFVEEFVLTGYKEVTKNVDFLLRPGDTYEQDRLPKL